MEQESVILEISIHTHDTSVSIVVGPHVNANVDATERRPLFDGDDCVLRKQLLKQNVLVE